MGCFASKKADSSEKIGIWRRTGVIALSQSNLKEFPGETLQLNGSVRTLDLMQNKIAVLPSEINKLFNLQRLILADNLINRLPENLGKLQKLKVLMLNRNRIASLPDELGQLVMLEKLFIAGNMLDHLPETIGSLQKLILLDVSSNKVNTLPESIGSCSSLEDLKANDNHIKRLPDSVCNLVLLKSLSLDNNKIAQLPDKILACCTSLQSISFHDNPISITQFKKMDGFGEFESRRKGKIDKQITSNVMFSSHGMDVGIDW